MPVLTLALWNANGLTQHKLELEQFLRNHDIDVMLISETHFTIKNHFKINGYTIYDTKHPDGKAHGGTAVILRNRIKHYELPIYSEEYMQATSIFLEEGGIDLTLTAIYCPPRFNLKTEQFSQFFKTLGGKFIAGGDFNAKHTLWGSRIINPKGKQLWNCIQNDNLDHISSGSPTYWPSDRNKIPDLIDFCVIKGIVRSCFEVQSCYDLSSDHSPVIVSMQIKNNVTEYTQSLTNRHTNWIKYKEILNKKCDLKVSLKNANDIDKAVNYFTDILKYAARNSTPRINSRTKVKNLTQVHGLISTKRSLRRQWQQNRSPSLKSKLNKATRELRKALNDFKNQNLKQYLEALSPNADTDYSLWKATKNLKRPTLSNPPLRKKDGTWARSDSEKVSLFAEYLSDVFQPNPLTGKEHKISCESGGDYGAKWQFKWKHIRALIKREINPKKAPGYDDVSAKMVQELPDVCIKLLTYILNAMLRLDHFPDTWKIAQIIMIPKTGKDVTQVASYRPISVLPVLSKTIEKAICHKLTPILERDHIIPQHQFGFREKHNTTEQVHRVVSEIKNALETKRYCSAVFLDVAQAFDKVWHEGLIHKIKLLLPDACHGLLQSYLKNRRFKVKRGDSKSELCNIHAGVPQGSALGPLLYIIYTADIPVSTYVKLATFADDTAILATHQNRMIASRELQEHLDTLQLWFQQWRIKVNESKSAHVTFTLKKQTCPMVKLNNIHIAQKTEVKYLGFHLDRRLTWKRHIEAKRKQMKLKFSKMSWLMGAKSSLKLESKVLLYKAIIIPIWSYGIQMWGSASASNLELLQRSQSRILRSIVNAPWYVRNSIIHSDLNIETVKEAITKHVGKYKSKLEHHPNELARRLLGGPKYRRLRRRELF